MSFNSDAQVPEMSQKIDCRGQIEMIKRMLVADCSERKKHPGRSELSASGSQADREPRESRRYKPDGGDDEGTELGKLNACLTKYSCASLIDNVECKMRMLLYHEQDVSKQFLISFRL